MVGHWNRVRRAIEIAYGGPLKSQNAIAWVNAHQTIYGQVEPYLCVKCKKD